MSRLITIHFASFQKDGPTNNRLLALDSQRNNATAGGAIGSGSEGFDKNCNSTGGSGQPMHLSNQQQHGATANNILITQLQQQQQHSGGKVGIDHIRSNQSRSAWHIQSKIPNKCPKSITTTRSLSPFLALPFTCCNSLSLSLIQYIYINISLNHSLSLCLCLSHHLPVANQKTVLVFSFRLFSAAPATEQPTFPALGSVGKRSDILHASGGCLLRLHVFQQQQIGSVV